MNFFDVMKIEPNFDQKLTYETLLEAREKLQTKGMSESLSPYRAWGWTMKFYRGELVKVNTELIQWVPIERIAFT